jgi:tetratricopeptide (TPR) repeat protein
MLRIVFLFLLVIVTCFSPQPDAQAGEVVLLEGIGSYSRPATTSSPEAKAYFDQGLVMYFGFNHEAAVDAFARAAEIDPDFALAHWGVAASLGPNINNMEMDETAVTRAFESSRRALELVETVTPVEQALISALAVRYEMPAPEDRAHLDSAYAASMGEVWAEFGGDADAGALYAEALMDLRPWDLWNSVGDPQPGTEQIVELLAVLRELEPDHPGIHHFTIHTLEASLHPEDALPSADRLRDMTPIAGHLLHMPGHIDLRLGHYNNAILANQKAIEADLRYLEEAKPAPGFYTLYRAHNYHFLAYAAMFEGRKALALEAARDMIAQIPMEMVRAFPDFLDGFLAVPLHVMVRFGMWEELLAEPAPPEDMAATIAFSRYSRTVAFSALGRVEEAEAEFLLLKEAAAAVPETRMIGNNGMETILGVAFPMAEGELEYRKGNYDRAFELLRLAVRRDEDLRYDEPWGWMQPVRHALGALLLEQGRLADAEKVYREDMRLHPENGWSLHGLAEALRRQDKTEEAAQAEEDYKRVWARADVVISASCYCRGGELAKSGGR